ncbi:hypothetical protein [Aeromicrobium sp.]|uniref:hypothetical protein n=1 Tax=Aeromicrobium sp. TaxID=1871063 RepID=UPI00403473DA
MSPEQQKRVNVALLALACAIAFLIAGFTASVGSLATDVTWSSSVILMIVAAIFSLSAVLPTHRGSVLFLVAGLVLAASVIACIDVLPLIEGVGDVDEFLPAWGSFAGTPLALIVLGIGRGIASHATHEAS